MPLVQGVLCRDVHIMWSGDKSFTVLTINLLSLTQPTLEIPHEFLIIYLYSFTVLMSSVRSNIPVAMMSSDMMLHVRQLRRNLQ